MNKVWDLVSERRLRPARPRAHSRDEEDLSQADIATTKIAADKYDAYEKDFNKAACLLVESISDSQLLTVTSVLDDPIAIWNKLQQKFARKSEMGKSAAQKALLNFQHLETETADETICRFEAVVERCEQQGVRIYDDEKERALLVQPNDRYEHLKKTWQHSKDKQDLQELFASMRDDDEDFQRKAAPPSGSAALADAF